MLPRIASNGNHPSPISPLVPGFAGLAGVLAVVLLLFGAIHSRAGETADPLVYAVKRGDTLSGIAQTYGVSVDQLRRWNGIRGHTIYAGQRLVLRLDTRPATYVVRSGDTLSEIAVRFGISVPSLRERNAISGDRIYPDQTLALRAPEAVPGASPIYVVRRGDTLWDIARMQGVSVSDLKDINGLSSDAIAPGMRLRLAAVSESPREEEPFEYLVKQGDSLSDIARRFNTGTRLLMQLNRLTDDRIHPGQKLQLRPSSLEEAVHVVRPGETLSSIAKKYGLDPDELARLNDIEGSRILAGQKLRLKATPAHIHIVEPGDALWEIADAYGLTVKELKDLNGLTSDRIYPGQQLELGARLSVPTDTYTVKNGDYLGRIARLHQMSISELKTLNGLRASVIYPGQELKVNPILRTSHKLPAIGEIHWDELVASVDGLVKIPAENGPYFGRRPEADQQPHAGYFEGPRLSVAADYRQAQKLWLAFNREVTRLGTLNNALKGWHVVLDPGHGGLDPGAVVENLDGNGDKVYVVEDEYVYDVALRVYVMLRLHGAEVTLTLLSPNHLIRRSSPPVRTFVNEKNEVYNDAGFNRKGRWSDRPNGGPDGNIRRRVEIARKVCANARAGRCIFLSFHADIDPGAPEAPLVLYYESRSRRVDAASRQFARSLLSAFGAGAHTRGQNLAVLRDNPARIKVVIELRNLAYTDHAWALRYEELRQRDAEKVVRGVLDYAGGTG